MRYYVEPSAGRKHPPTVLALMITSDNVQVSYGLFWMCSLLHGRDELTIDENVEFLRTQYDEDDTRTREDSGYDKAVASLLQTLPEEAISLRFWRSVYYCGLAAFLDTSVISSITALLSSYDPSHFDGKTQLQLLATAYGRVLAELLHHRQPQSSDQKQGLELFIVEAIRLGLDVHEGFNHYTPLEVMLSSFSFFWDQGDMVPQCMLNKALNTWVRLVERAGVDICQYGESELCRFELHQFSQTPALMFVDWYHDVLEDTSRWAGPGTNFPLAISCGTSSFDWRIALLGFSEECSQDFWRSVEAQVGEVSYYEYVPPGGWIED